MSEREPHTSFRYIEPYRPTIPDSQAAWDKAADSLISLLLHAPAEPLPPNITIIYPNEPKALHLDFTRGLAFEMDMRTVVEHGKEVRIFDPTGTSIQFQPAIDPHDRIQRVEDVKRGIEDMLRYNPPKVNARTN